MTLDEFLRQMGSGHGFVVALGISFVAGIVASAVCPCTVPVGLGMATVAGASESTERRQGLRVAAAFAAGIVINLTLLGIIASRLGALATESFGRSWSLVMAIFSVVAAIAAFWGPRLKVRQLEALRRPGVLGAFAYGFVFSLGTSVAPLLLLLTVSAARARPEQAAPLALLFGLGRAAPFLVVGLLATAITRFVDLGHRRRVLQIGSGLAMLFVGWYYADAYLALQ